MAITRGTVQSDSKPCVHRDTRANILALRNSGGLTEGCLYIAIDVTHILAGGTAEFGAYATASGSLSDSGIYTSPVLNPNEGWHAVMDWDNGAIEYVFDSVNNNEVSSAISTANFPFGVSTVNENIVKQGGRLIYSGGSFIRNVIDTQASVTIIGGSNTENTFSQESAYTQQGTGTINQSRVLDNNTVINGNLTIIACSFENQTSFNGTDAVGLVYRSSFKRASIALTGATGVAIQDTNFHAFAYIIANGATEVNFYRSSIISQGYIVVSSGARINCSYSTVQSRGYVQVTQGRLRISYSTIQTNAYLQQQSTSLTNIVSQSTLSSNSRTLFQNGTTGARVYYSNNQSRGLLYFLGTNTNPYFYYGNVMTNGYVRFQNSTNIRAYQNSISDNGYLWCANNTSANYFYYNTVSSGGRIYYYNNGGSDVRAYWNNCNSYGLLYVRNSTAVGRVYRSQISAYFYLFIVFAGTSTVQGVMAYGRQTYQPTLSANLTGTAFRNI